MAKTTLKNLRFKFYREIKKRAMSLEGHLSAELKKYQQDQKKLAKRTFTFSNSQKLIIKAQKSHFIFIGDFHTFEQSQRNALRLIKLLFKKKKNICLALEMVSSENQHFINAYLNHQITEREFLEAIDYNETWRFPWSHYRHFFQLAKKENFPILALNSQGTLPERDSHAANILTHHHRRFQKYSYITLIGELHILPDNLPLKLASKIQNPKLKNLIIHQNLDEVFWKLYDRPMREDHIIMFNEQEFSINSSPPWLKYESMVYWFEQTNDDPAFDLHEYIMQTGLKVFGPNADDNFMLLGQQLNQFFNLQLSPDEIEDFDLHDHKKTDYLVETIEHSSPRKNLLTLYINLLNRNISFKFYHNNDYYCSNYNLNRFAGLVGIHLFHKKHHVIKPYYIRNLFLKRSTKSERFLFLCYEKMFSYLSSKVFNPYIKCELYKNLSHSSQSHISSKALEVLDGKQTLKNLLTPINLTDMFLISRVVGEFLGEALFRHLNQKNKNLDNAMTFFFKAPYKEVDFNKIKQHLLTSKTYKMQRKRNF